MEKLLENKKFTYILAGILFILSIYLGLMIGDRIW